MCTDNIVKELEKELSDIEEIQGRLKITRTFSLISLSFFKNLRVIGSKLQPNELFALHIMDNANLADLFPNNVTIEQGRLFFHFNPKLCIEKIERLKPWTVALNNVTSIAIEDVALNSNGDKVACEWCDATHFARPTECDR